MADPVADVAIYALDVGQGDATFVLSGDPGEGAILFDCKDAYVAERFVLDHGIHVLHAVVISHLDVDHIAGVLPFLRWFVGSDRTVQRVFVGLDRDRTKLGVTAARLAEALLRWADERRFSLHAPQREREPSVVWEVPNRWSASIVTPRYADILGMRIDGGEEPNRCSVALRVECGGNAVLVGGDATLAAWEVVESSLLPAWGFRAPHHGGNIREAGTTWTEGDLYKRVDPRVVAVSVGTCNKNGHPASEQLEAIDPGLAPGQRRLVCTQLTPVCHDDVQGVRAEMLRSASRVTYAPYRHVVAPGSKRRRPRSEVPCAGTIAMELFANGTTAVEPPDPGWHGDQIRRLRFTSPRCRVLVPR